MKTGLQPSDFVFQNKVYNSEVFSYYSETAKTNNFTYKEWLNMKVKSVMKW